MSGIELAGLVLGAFPILLNCLDYYRQGFEPLEEWWNFRTHFIAFVDDIRHQKMRYHENLVRLLDVVVTDNTSLNELVGNPKDERWTNGTLTGPLERRLGSELDRFLRIVDRMHEEMRDLHSLLQIEAGRISWLGTATERPWQWHLKRMRIAFSKGKHKKVKKLAKHNQELQEILGCSERTFTIADRRKTLQPVQRLEKIRQQATRAYTVLCKRWQCGDGCRDHMAHLRIWGDNATGDPRILFSKEHPALPAFFQEVTVVTSASQDTKNITTTSDLTFIQHSVVLSEIQQVAETQHSLEKPRGPVLQKLSSKLKDLQLSRRGAGEENSASSSVTFLGGKKSKSVRFRQIPTISVTTHESGHSEAAETTSEATLAVTDENSALEATSAPHVCGFLADPAQKQCSLHDDLDSTSTLVLQKLTPPKPRDTKLLSLHDALHAYHHQAALELSRQARFEMAAHIASALLQTHRTPWLQSKWSSQSFSLLVGRDDQALETSQPFVSRSFPAEEEDEELHLEPGHSEEETRSYLFTVGVIILELIFGHNIEDCSFRKDYYGAGDKPNDQTDISTARRWAKKVLGESGPNIADVVRRCLDCSFGPRPCFGNVRFRESVYEGVIKPLAGYSRAWPEVM